MTAPMSPETESHMPPEEVTLREVLANRLHAHRERRENLRIHMANLALPPRDQVIDLTPSEPAAVPGLRDRSRVRRTQSLIEAREAARNKAFRFGITPTEGIETGTSLLIGRRASTKARRGYDQAVADIQTQLRHGSITAREAETMLLKERSDRPDLQTRRGQLRELKARVKAGEITKAEAHHQRNIIKATPTGTTKAGRKIRSAKKYENFANERLQRLNGEIRPISHGELVPDSVAPPDALIENRGWNAYIRHALAPVGSAETILDPEQSIRTIDLMAVEMVAELNGADARQRAQEVADAILRTIPIERVRSMTPDEIRATTNEARRNATHRVELSIRENMLRDFFSPNRYIPQKVYNRISELLDEATLGIEKDFQAVTDARDRDIFASTEINTLVDSLTTSDEAHLIDRVRRLRGSTNAADQEARKYVERTGQLPGKERRHILNRSRVNIAKEHLEDLVARGERRDYDRADIQILAKAIAAARHLSELGLDVGATDPILPEPGPATPDTDLGDTEAFDDVGRELSIQIGTRINEDYAAATHELDGPERLEIREAAYRAVIADYMGISEDDLEKPENISEVQSLRRQIDQAHEDYLAELRRRGR